MHHNPLSTQAFLKAGKQWPIPSELIAAAGASELCGVGWTLLALATGAG